MKHWIKFLPILFLLGCGNFPDTLPDQSNSIYPADSVIELSDLGPAPELTNEIWINSEVPLRLADLRGQVVLLDMWTFG